LMTAGVAAVVLERSVASIVKAVDKILLFVVRFLMLAVISPELAAVVTEATTLDTLNPFRYAGIWMLKSPAQLFPVVVVGEAIVVLTGNMSSRLWTLREPVRLDVIVPVVEITVVTLPTDRAVKVASAAELVPILVASILVARIVENVASAAEVLPIKVALIGVPGGV